MINLNYVRKKETF